MVIDDEEMNLTLISFMLAQENFRVICAGSAEDGLALLREERPRIILMDIRLTGMDGLEATRGIKADPDLSSIPIIAVSAYAMPEDLDRASQAGCSAYLRKPFRKEELLQTLRGLLRQ